MPRDQLQPYTDYPFTSQLRSEQTPILIELKDLPKWALMDLAEGDPCKSDKTKEE
jgi:hypothetical protein